VNESSKNFAVVEKGIRFGLAAIKNVGGAAVDSILAERDRHGRFTSFYDFCCRIDLQKVNKRVIEGLIKVGAFDSMQTASRAQLMAVLDQTLEQASAFQRERALGQTSLFDALGGTAPSLMDDPDRFLSYPQVPDWNLQERLKFERELTGFYITAHPLSQHAHAVAQLATHTTANLAEAGDGKEVKICGVIGTVKTMTTKRGERMAYVQLEDLHGLLEVIVFPDLYKLRADLLMAETVIHVTGIVDHMETGCRIKATAIEPLQEVQSKSIKQVVIRLTDQTPGIARKLPQLRDVLKRHPGPASLALEFQLSSRIHAATATLPNWSVMPSDHLLYEVEQLLGKQTVLFR
ncbi:MAG: DNA polymerase III subunit alpha, partial [Nitrospirae bacterium]